MRCVLGPGEIAYKWGEIGRMDRGWSALHSGCNMERLQGSGSGAQETARWGIEVEKKRKMREKKRKPTWAPADEDGDMRNGNICRIGHIRIAACRASLPPCSVGSGYAASSGMSG